MAAQPIDKRFASKYEGQFNAAVNSINSKGEVSDSANASPVGIRVDQTCYKNGPTGPGEPILPG